MKDFLIRPFFYGCILASLATLWFFGYVIYRQANATGGEWDFSYIHHLAKWFVYANIGAALLGIGLSVYGLRFFKRKNRLYLVFFIPLFIGACVGLYFGNDLIHHVEGVYTKKSWYFHKFLTVAYPLMLCMLTGLIGTMVKPRFTAARDTSSTLDAGI